MADGAVEMKFKHVMSAIARRLKERGFSKAGNAFRMFHDGNCGIIEAQRSQQSSATRIVFTFNIGVICGQLLDQESDIRRLHEYDAHLRQRIGFLLPSSRDHWWELSAATDEKTLGEELAAAIETGAVPFLLRNISTEALGALWASGSSPGLTDLQRQRHLKRLQAT